MYRAFSPSSKIHTMKRRQFLSYCGKVTSISALASTSMLWPVLAQALPAAPGSSAEPFDFDMLQERASALAARPYTARGTQLPPPVAALTWEQFQHIRFRDDHALWSATDSPLNVKFIHMGLLFRSPVAMYRVENGMAQPIAFDPQMYDYGEASGITREALTPYAKELGFAGMQFLTPQDMARDVAVFLGASYFRAVSSSMQYGLSARGLAVNTAMGYPEEFPDFIAFWLEKPAAGAQSLTVYALLDSPSVAGAYRFIITPGTTLTMDVCTHLYPRKEMERVGIAPSTSMFQYAENDKRMAWDWRPEIHDSDGLQMLTGTGEWIWRPIVNPARLRFNAFQDINPRGFGLVQRDRNFDHYQEDGVYYNLRPSLWVEPRGKWGKGAVDLVEIPTVDENFDNIVMFWSPDDMPRPGKAYTFEYRLSWCNETPVQPPLARCIDTFTGLGGVPGVPRKVYSRRFVVDFAGPAIDHLPADAKVDVIVEATRGTFDLIAARPQHEKKAYRVTLDLRPDDSTEQITIRLFLQHSGQLLTETWLYQWNPPPVDQRTLY